MSRRPTCHAPAALLAAALLALPLAAAAAPGDLLRSVSLPVAGNGTSVAADCEGGIYYTNDGDAALHRMDADGVLLGSVPITERGTGAPLFLDELAWDATRQELWTALHGTDPVRVYRLDPLTGLASFAFTSATPGRTWCDGLAVDGSDDTLWLSADRSPDVEHYAPDGTLLGTITPTDAAGGVLDMISGVFVGVGDLLYLGQAGRAQIVSVRKSDGGFLSLFSSPGGNFDEGLECDPVSFAPKLALWSREWSLSAMLAIEVEPDTCACGGGGCPDDRALAAAGPDVAICAGAIHVLDGVASMACDAAGLQYQWSSGAGVVCPWSPSPRCAVTPAATTTYTLEVQCTSFATCVDSDEVIVTVAPPPVAALAPAGPICAGESITLDAAGSQPGACTLPLAFRFRVGPVVLRDFAAASTYGPLSPPASTTYEVDVRCGPLGTCYGTSSQLVVVGPGQVPGDLGNTLRAVERGRFVAMSWQGDPFARTYVLRRGTAKGVWPLTPLRTGLVGSSDSEPDVPPPPPLYFYRAAGASCGGAEGP